MTFSQSTTGECRLPVSLLTMGSETMGSTRVHPNHSSASPARWVSAGSQSQLQRGGNLQHQAGIRGSLCAKHSTQQQIFHPVKKIDPTVQMKSFRNWFLIRTVTTVDLPKE